MQFNHPIQPGWLFTGEMKKIDEKFIAHGVGTMTNQADGRQIRAQWTDGIIFQQATIIYPNGHVYRGRLHDMIPDGQGQLQTADGTVFSGQWTKGELNSGTEQRSNSNEVYEGQFQNLKRHGEGELYNDSSSLIRGVWVHGLMVQKHILGGD